MIASSCSTTTHRVAARLQIAQGVDQPLVVAGMQADRRLVEHVAHADQPRAEAGGQAHALQLAAAEGVGRPVEREIFQPDVVEEFQPRGDLADDRLGDGLLVVVELQLGEEARARRRPSCAVTSWIALPPTRTARASGRSRAPPHAGRPPRRGRLRAAAASRSLAVVAYSFSKQRQHAGELLAVAVQQLLAESWA